MPCEKNKLEKRIYIQVEENTPKIKIKTEGKYMKAEIICNKTKRKKNCNQKNIRKENKKTIKMEVVCTEVITKTARIIGP